MITILLTVITLVSIIYPAYACGVNGGVPESLSTTYYILGKNGWWFQVAMSLVGFLLLPVWLNVSDENTQFLVFLACAGLLFVAAAPAFHLKLDGVVHYSAAVVCCVCAFVWQVLNQVWGVTLLFAFVGLILFLQWGKWCFWLELAVVGSAITNLWRMY